MTPIDVKVLRELADRYEGDRDAFTVAGDAGELARGVLALLDERERVAPDDAALAATAAQHARMQAPDFAQAMNRVFGAVPAELGVAERKAEYLAVIAHSEAMIAAFDTAQINAMVLAGCVPGLVRVARGALALLDERELEDGRLTDEEAAQFAEVLNHPPAPSPKLIAALKGAAIRPVKP